MGRCSSTLTSSGIVACALCGEVLCSGGDDCAAQHVPCFDLDSSADKQAGDDSLTAWFSEVPDPPVASKDLHVAEGADEDSLKIGEVSVTHDDSTLVVGEGLTGCAGALDAKRCQTWEDMNIEKSCGSNQCSSSTSVARLMIQQLANHSLAFAVGSSLGLGSMIQSG